MGLIKINDIIYGTSNSSEIIYRNTTVQEKLDTIPVFDPSDNAYIEANQYDYLTYGHIIDTLNSDATDKVLSANQGKILQENIENNTNNINSLDIEIEDTMETVEDINLKLTNLLSEYTDKIASLEKSISTINSNISSINSQLNNRLKLSGLTQIPANSNLNNYTTVGNYASSSNANTKTLSNCPVQVAFSLYVTNATGSSQTSATTSNAYVYFLQQIIDMHGNKYVRTITYNNSTSPTFGSWVSK